MAIIKVNWLPEAVADLQRLRVFIHSHNPAAAAKAASRIKQVINLLVDTPELGKPVQDDVLLEYRDLYIPFGSSSYAVRYRLNNNHIIITNLWHSKEIKNL